MQTVGVYLMDFGRLDPASPAGGANRVRLLWDPDAKKLAASTAEPTGTNYRENYIISTLEVDTWYYVGITALANADVLVRLGTQKGASYIGTTLPPVSVTRDLPVSPAWRPRRHRSDKLFPGALQQLDMVVRLDTQRQPDQRPRRRHGPRRTSPA